MLWFALVSILLLTIALHRFFSIKKRYVDDSFPQGYSAEYIEVMNSRWEAYKQKTKTT